jgi:subtilisin-like proprotein convertase family protein
VQLKSLCLTIAAAFAFNFAIGMAAGAQAAVITTFSGPDLPVEICDTCTVHSTLNVASHGSVLDVDALLDITHSWDADLVLSLSHGGTTVLLANRQGGSGGANYTGTLFDDAAAISIAEGYAYAPYTGSFRPEQALAAFIGQDMFGQWTLTATDSEAGDSGVINSWSLTVNAGPVAADVPEPGSLALVGLGLLGVSLQRRRKG